ncbi:MAG: hypothetical protein AAF525_18985 [Pseudomonadota bacterium]
MAIIYQRSSKGVSYEVRTAGQSRRLYTNGAFHTQFHPLRTFTYGIWDLLTIPALYVPSQLDRVQRSRECRTTDAGSALILGVGGGTAIHQCHNLLAIRHTIGVELDPQHLYLAKRFFGLKDLPGLTLVEADATAWVSKHRQRHTLLVDDLYLHAPTGQASLTDPVRPALPPADRWLTTLAGRVDNHGVLVQNHLAAPAAARTTRDHGPTLNALFASALLFTTPRYTNGILALYKEPVSARRMARPVRKVLQQFGRSPEFTCRQLF